MAVRTLIEVRTRFEHVHHWPEAPAEVGFLRALHRHEFHVTLRLAVTHDDRELEFILVKRALDQYLKGPWSERVSCEQIAHAVLAWAKHTYGTRTGECSVLEDGENGAIVQAHID